jgi:tetratricopeptide (TPR) repeat protein
MLHKQRPKLLAALLGLIVVQAALHSTAVFPRWRKDYNTSQGSIASGLNGEQLLFALAGFREMVAGILWVRGDSFFDSGNYDAILPIIRLVTWLDPHQIDVYSTGMWHIAYNFTDDEQRSDRRYIPSALALGHEGVRQNPYTYELFFENGWLWYHKIDDDYPQAVKWFEQAHERSDIPPGRRNMLSNAYQRNNQIEDALGLYYKLLDQAEARYKEDPSPGNSSMRDTVENNIDTMLVRMVQRGWIAKKRNDGSYETGNYDTRPPFDVGFSVRAIVEEPKVLQLVGTYNVLPVGTRVRFVLRDKDYPKAGAATMQWDQSSDNVNLDPPRENVFLQDQLYIKNRRFIKRIDMSKDPTMYPIRKDKNYVLEFYYNPRMSPPHIQDKFGYNGEGFTDSNFLSTTVRPGQRVLYTSLEFSGEQILRRGKWSTEVPTQATKNYKPVKTVKDDDVIALPSLRGTAPQPIGQ